VFKTFSKKTHKEKFVFKDSIPEKSSKKWGKREALPLQIHIPETLSPLSPVQTGRLFQLGSNFDRSQRKTIQKILIKKS